MELSKEVQQTVDHLNSFLRGELSAVETYRQAMSKVDRPAIRTTLAQCERSHEQRVRLLMDEIIRRGGEPATSSGPWGTRSSSFPKIARPCFRFRSRLEPERSSP